jgi:hypothetical protein
LPRRVCGARFAHGWKRHRQSPGSPLAMPCPMTRCGREGVWGVGTLLGPEGTGPAPHPLCGGGVRLVFTGGVPASWRGGCCLWTVRALPAIPASLLVFFSPGSPVLCRAVRGGWLGVWCWWLARVSGWPWGVCELDSGCEHLDRSGPLRGAGSGSCRFLGLYIRSGFCCSALMMPNVARVAP